ncbi:hypothetical protein AAG570_010422 [Ranatra chinensis]|uniref:Uncharacterized protein n=1 Tax=Ranatra chinensis TaxID=642074 RepID=A0ABD0YMM2_9HEMI
MASKRRNMFHKNKTQETTEKEGIMFLPDSDGLSIGEGVEEDKGKPSSSDEEPDETTLMERWLSVRKQGVRTRLKGFRDHLAKTVDKLSDVLAEMCLLEPDLPADPVKYIRENVGFRMSEARRAQAALAKARAVEEVLEAEKNRLEEKLAMVKQLLAIEEVDEVLDLSELEKDHQLPSPEDLSDVEEERRLLAVKDFQVYGSASGDTFSGEQEFFIEEH